MDTSDSWEAARPGAIPVASRTDLGDLHVVVADVGDAYPEQIVSATRTWIAIMPHVVLIHDRLLANSPVRVETRFVTDNSRDRLNTNVATGDRLVLRREGIAMKLLRLGSITDEADSSAPVTSDTVALSDVDEDGQGIVRIFTTDRPGLRHEAVYALVIDEEPRIKGWHVTVDGPLVHISDPDETQATVDLDRCAPQVSSVARTMPRTRTPGPGRPGTQVLR